MPAGRQVMSQDERDLRLNRVAKLFIQGKSLRAIAEVVGVTNPQVLYDIRSIRKQWRAQRPTEFSEMIDEELARISNVESEAWDAWERSIGKKVKTKTVSGGEGGDTHEAQEWEDAGAAQYLSIIQTAIDQRIRLLGLNAPQKHEIKADRYAPQDQDEQLVSALKELENLRERRLKDAQANGTN